MALELFVLGAAAATFIVAKQLALVSPKVAREWLKKGALVVDVRNEAEFKHEHLPGTLNMPLPHLTSRVKSHAPDQNQPILLHCLSGSRSSRAKAMLLKLGYRNCFNLGSLARARRILAGQSAKRD